MRVVVLGAGMLGVTSAYYLAQLGHEVTVIDRHATPCAKARGRVEAVVKPPMRPVLLATPPDRLNAIVAAIRRTAREKLGRFGSIFEVPRPDPVENRVRLLAYSRATERALHDEAGAPAPSGSAGLLKFYMDPRAFECLEKRAPRLNALGCEAQLVSADEAVRIEPALIAMRPQIAGGTFLANDPPRDPAPAATRMVFLCRAAGVRFLSNHTVVALHAHEGRISHVDLVDPNGQLLEWRAQAYVMALGTGSAEHADALGIEMPLHAEHEYIVTLPIKNAARAPHVGLHDASGKLRITRVHAPEGDSLRVSARVHAEADEAREPDADRFNAILRRVALLLPGAVDASRAQFEMRTHAASADGLPLVGKTRLRNLFLNTAPGAHGWVHACGAGKSIARIVSGLRPELSFAFTGM
ncbi:FAD-dependent oxidoreductase [Variovorax sp. PAMC 28711]|uniref:FAD-dependent oxidoreductase n=1 Tax=Variovorax sp. PAMC 28711 TaxID=1795631 RepID=UPI0009E993DD|nr:FAD-dependent oxidoreductase [Variovorax sp. PAMC 28711]